MLELEGGKVKWGEQRLGTGASISYAFADEPLAFAKARNCGELAPVEKLLGNNISRQTLVRETAAAFRVWERVAGLSFHQVSHTQDADIIFGAQGKPEGRAFANVSYEPDASEGIRTIKQALLCLNPEHKWKVGFDGDVDVYDLRYTLIHEIGHALGLDHPGRSGQVMAFRYTEAFDDLQPGDLLGIQILYGQASEAQLANSRVTQISEMQEAGYQADHSNDNAVENVEEDKINSGMAFSDSASYTGKLGSGPE
ncbi:hypothetical protein GCM10027098_19510 [Bowmanella dokdonensis]